MTNKRPLIIYHGGCRDGFAAAWVAWKAFAGQADFFAAHYDRNAVPPIWAAGRRVFVLDFSYKRMVMRKLIEDAENVVVLDHHKTAEAELEGLPGCHFDMDRSGAGMTWDYFYEGQPRPWPVGYVEDRDLWRFKLPSSKEVNAFLGTVPLEFEAWDQLATLPFEKAVFLGTAVNARTKQYVAEVAKNAMWIEFEGCRVPIVNAPHVDISELVGHLAEDDVPFALGWSQRSDGRFNYSLRSRKENGVDVSIIAKKYDGGGHKSSAGFVVDKPVHFSQGS